jgi:hypothetical protein
MYTQVTKAFAQLQIYILQAVRLFNEIYSPTMTLRGQCKERQHTSFLFRSVYSFSTRFHSIAQRLIEVV